VKQGEIRYSCDMRTKKETRVEDPTRGTLKRDAREQSCENTRGSRLVSLVVSSGCG